MTASQAKPSPRLTPLRADLLLLVCACVWGISFLWQKQANNSVGALTYVGARCLLGGLVVLPLAMRQRRRSAPLTSAGRRALLVGGLAAGLCMATASVFQQTGLQSTTITNAGFITGLYVVFVPFLGSFAGQRVRVHAWFGVLLAIAGMFLLSFSHVTSVRDFSGFVEGLSTGDLWVLACAATWAVHVQVVGWAAKRTDPVALSVLQFFVGGAAATAMALAFEGPTIAGLQAAATPIVLSAVFAVGLAFTLQAIAQDVAPPTHTAILLSLESVFGALTGVIWLGEEMGARQFAGAGLMLGAALVAQWPTKARYANAATSATSGATTASTCSR